MLVHESIIAHFCMSSCVWINKVLGVLCIEIQDNIADS